MPVLSFVDASQVGAVHAESGVLRATATSGRTRSALRGHMHRREAPR